MLDIVIESRKAFIGHGLNVHRILPFTLRRMLGLFQSLWIIEVSKYITSLSLCISSSPHFQLRQPQQYKGATQQKLHSYSNAGYQKNSALQINRLLSMFLIKEKR